MSVSFDLPLPILCLSLSSVLLISPLRLPTFILRSYKRISIIVDANLLLQFELVKTSLVASTLIGYLLGVAYLLIPLSTQLVEILDVIVPDRELMMAFVPRGIYERLVS